jgi:hypothetical protein
VKEKMQEIQSIKIFLASREEREGFSQGANVIYDPTSGSLINLAEMQADFLKA